MATYHLGLPAWAFPGWAGQYFDNQPSSLTSYARVFNTVEGNTTFYSLPEEKTVASWKRSVEGSAFRFCFKLPREVTHQSRPDFEMLATFCDRISPLNNHLGPLLLQFPATVGPSQLPLIESVVSRLPAGFRSVLEVRNIDLFRAPEPLIALIEKYQLGLAVMDTRAVFQGDRFHH